LKILAQLFLEKQEVLEELFFSCFSLCNDDSRDYKLIHLIVTFNDLFVHEGFRLWHMKFVTTVIGIISQFRSLSVFVNIRYHTGTGCLHTICGNFYDISASNISCA
jgi:hypothetical protein